MTANQLIAMLAKRYAPPAYAFMQQVRNATGFARTVRTADALALSLWPSRGIYLCGFEIKVSRTDWQKELKDPEKAEEIARFCDRWWIVVSDAAIVQAGELPPTWGLMAVVKDKLKVIKEAPDHDAQPLTKPMLASILRNVAETMVLQSAITEKVQEAYQRGQQHSTYEYKRAHDELKRNVEAFEKASGLTITRSWECGDIGRAVKLVREARLWKLQGAPKASAEALRNHAQKTAEEMSSLIELLDKIDPPQETEDAA